MSRGWPKNHENIHISVNSFLVIRPIGYSENEYEENN